ncbi:class I SAM-dependent methyltransferase [Streptomyces boninensis]|uniref:class I SAM-dependent methyltransferase n=1 Tax=Streptomyces boninensis TaxID=2039455 RepID=UPI003B223F4A
MPGRSSSSKPPRDAVHHPLFARFYARMSPRAEQGAGIGAYRDQLLDGLTGRVIEIGAGNGLNFAHYPNTVSEVVAIEPERRLRRLAAEAALRAGIPVDVVPGTAEALPVKSEAFDAAVASLVLCSVRDPERSLRELRRVLRPGGQLRFFEHVRSHRTITRAAQWTVDHTVWPLLLGGCHTSRDTVAAIKRAGFEVGPYDEIRVPFNGPAAGHVLGSARKPA